MIFNSIIHSSHECHMCLSSFPFHFGATAALPVDEGVVLEGVFEAVISLVYKTRMITICNPRLTPPFSQSWRLACFLWIYTAGYAFLGEGAWRIWSWWIARMRTGFGLHPWPLLSNVLCCSRFSEGGSELDREICSIAAFQWTHSIDRVHVW